MSENTAAIVLAAGASTRLGRSKQLVLFRGEPLLRRSVRLAFAAGAGPVLVVTAGDPGVRGLLDGLAADGLPMIQIHNPDPREGMHTSLRIGMRALADGFPFAERVLLLVCDQPLLRPEHLQALFAAPGSVAAAHYDGHLGVPAVFGREHFAALAGGSGDQGARALLRTLPVTPVAIPEAAFDIDTPEDLINIENFDSSSSEGWS